MRNEVMLHQSTNDFLKQAFMQPGRAAMQIIAELEGATRGPYADCMGDLSVNGNLDTCITIRAPR